MDSYVQVTLRNHRQVLSSRRYTCSMFWCHIHCSRLEDYVTCQLFRLVRLRFCGIFLVKISSNVKNVVGRTNGDQTNNSRCEANANAKYNVETGCLTQINSAVL